MKKEIEEQIGKDWEEVNSQLPNGVNPHAYRLGYLKGYQKALEERPSWIDVPNDTTKIPTGFLLAYGLNEHGKERRIRAYYVQPLTYICDLELNDENYDYSEEKDEFYLKEGWYECNDCEEINWRVTYTITHFMPLPTSPFPNPKENA